MLNTATIRSTSDPAIKLAYPRDTLTIDVDGYPAWSLQGTTTYDLGAFTLNSSGGTYTVGGTGALSVSNSGVTLGTGWYRPLDIAANGLALTIPVNGWQSYSNLTSTYLGLVTTLEINSGNALGITFQYETLVYQFRNTSWATTANASDTDVSNGWTQVDSGGYITSAGTVTVYSKTFSAGSYTFDNESAMYMFNPNRTTTVPAGGLFTEADPFANISITPPASYTAPDFKISKRIQLQATRVPSLYLLEEFRESIRAKNNVVPYNQEQLQKEDGTIKEYNIARAIASNVTGSGGGGGGGVTETEYWF